MLKFRIRDDDDWIQLEHIFLNEGFNLSETGRMREMKAAYDQIVAAGKTPLIVDLGANIGLASAYFGHVYPKADIVSVEPDTSNCAIAERNLPDRATLVPGAISSRTGSATLIDKGRNCAFQVDSSQEGEVRLVTMTGILRDKPERVPFIVKIDIEGFEEDLFSTDVEWVDRFPILLIELHDWLLPGRRVTRNFLSTVAAREREFMHFGGFVVSLATPLSAQS